jgi:hypothetical protein
MQARRFRMIGRTTSGGLLKLVHGGICITTRIVKLRNGGSYHVSVGDAVSQVTSTTQPPPSHPSLVGGYVIHSVR